MELTIFYSWQTSTDTKYNKTFINKCIEKAIKKIKVKPEFQNVKFTLIEAIRGEPGSPPLASKIIDERIPNCDIFIADLSVINRLPWILRKVVELFKVKFEPTQNNNVINEHGVAANAIGYGKIIGILNKAYGSPHDNPENIPFDLRHLRFPIEYNYTKKSKDKEYIQNQLINDLSGALSDTAKFALQHQRDKYLPLQVWATWAKNIPTSHSFIQNDKILEIKKVILEGLKKPNESIRLLGLSGLGKTRILFEIFRPLIGNAESEELSNRVLYINCNLPPNPDFQTIFSNLDKNQENRIVILDNCQKTLLRQVMQAIQKESNKTSVISIDNNPEEIEHDKIIAVNYIIIKKEDLSSVVNDILIQDFSVLPEENREKIKEFSQGIPFMAVLIGESLKGGEKFIGKLDDKELLDKLLGLRGLDERSRTIVKSCSLFNYFGVEEELRSQVEFIATEKNITSLSGDNQVIINEFDEVINHFLRREIFERKGRLIGMRPRPLAMSLAQEWLSPCTQGRLINVITSIAKLPDPDRKLLTEAFSEQMKYLGYDDKAVFIIERIVGPGSPFDNAEVLNTELGSRLFRSFVEVNPVAISKNLSRVFLGKTKEELLEIKEGRRNLVWVLEKLCFDKRTFTDGAKIMYSFAVAENETWANNATGQFIHLFNIMLPGTEADLTERWNIIQWGLNQSQKEYHDIAVKAMSVGLNYGHFYRDGGSEKQGGKTLFDYQPSWKEVAEYWSKILITLTDYIKSGSEYAKVAEDIIAKDIRSICNARMAHVILPVIEDVAKFKNGNWDEALKGLKYAKKYEKNSLNQQQLEKINELIESLVKTDFGTKYRNISSSFHLEDEENFSTERLKEAIISLADEFINNDLPWDIYFPLFYTHQQFYSYYFGKRVYELLKNNSFKTNEFINLSIKTILQIPKNEREISVFAGFIAEIDESVRNRVYTILSQEDELNYLLFSLISQDPNGKKDFDILFKLVDDQKSDLNNFKIFIHGASITTLNNEELNEFCNRLFKHGELGYIIVFEILFGITYRDKDKFIAIKPLFRACIYKLGFNIEWVNQIDEFKWVNVICEILENHEETEFANFINKSLIDSITLNNNYHLDHEVQRLYGVLLKDYFSTIWPYLSHKLISEGEDYIKFYGLKHILGSHIGGFGLNEGLITYANHDKIFQWCGENKPLAPTRLAELVPIFAGKNDDFSGWHPLTLRLIDEFGDLDGVLSSLGANMGSFSWTGSIVPLLEGRLHILNLVSNHRIKTVADWAKREITYLEKAIKSERNRDEEMYLT
jgi:hypothetical protein